MASWTNETRLGGTSPGFIADLRDLVAGWQQMAAAMRARAGELSDSVDPHRTARDRMLTVADTYRRCADELDRRIILDDDEGE